MASKKVTIKGRGPELFGRGIDLLFGEVGDDPPAPAADMPTRKLSDRNGATEPPIGITIPAGATAPAREEAYLDVAGAARPASIPPVDEYLRLAAEAFFQAMLAAPTAIAYPAASSSQTLPIYDAVWPADGQAQKDQEDDIMPTPNPDNPIELADEPPAAQPAEEFQRRKVGVPSSNGKAGADDSALSGDIVKLEGADLTRQEAKEIKGRLRPSDLNALDREVDVLYDKVGTLLSGQRQEATVAFDILRRVRLILLKDPERYADAEYLVNQVRARTNQIEQSIAGGHTYGPKLFAYQTIWVAILALIALVTTINGTTFSAWIAYFLGVPMNSDQLNWAVLFLSTLAWGGIGGVTSALWSLHHHISVARDYDPVENLWYFSQPVMGIVLGGIVFLVMGAGFLVVQVDLSTTSDAALGARLLPAAIAVIAGFRQSMVLDLIERVIALIIPGQAEETQSLQATYQPASQQPPEEPMI
jgi:hypothetical protein